MGKKFWIIFFVLVLLVVIIVIVFFPNTKKLELENPPLPGEGQVIFIAEKDKKCVSDDDCMFVSVSCGDCGGDAVNKAHIEKYNLLFAEKCQDYKGGFCDWDYRETHEIKCVNSVCGFVACKNPGVHPCSA